VDIIKVEGYETMKPIHLFWRDGFEVAKWIFANSVFANHMSFDPKCVFYDVMIKEREYTEYMTGDFAWEYQVRLLL
jgi:hypothetical protein